MKNINKVLKNYMLTANIIGKLDTGATPVTSTINTFKGVLMGGVVGSTGVEKFARV